MKLYARIIAFLCAMLMLTACFSACAETNNPETTTEEPAQTIGPDDSVGAETQRVDKNGYLLDDIPDTLDYGKNTVTILYWADAERAEFDIQYEDTTNIVEEAIYTRNVTVMERLGVTFEWVGENGDSGDRANFAKFVENAFAGGTYYDVIATYSRTAGMLLVNGHLEDINQFDENYIDTTKPWWPKNMLDTCTIDDSLFFVSGDISTNVLHFMYAVYYNIDMLTNLGLDDPITKVDDKTWTIDALSDYTKELYQDTDSSDTATDGDTYGFCSTYFHLDAFYTGSALKLVEDDKDGVIKISDDFWSNKCVDLVDKLSAWFKRGDSFVNPSGGGLDYDLPFEEGRALFCLNRVYMADNEYNSGSLRNVEWEYGILPVPLYSEDQGDYITVVGNPFTLWCVMKNASNTAMSSAVIECMASEAYRKTSPALFQNNMKYRYTPDSAGKGDGARMFDIIRESISFDLGRIFSDSLSFMSELPSKAAAKKGSWAAEMRQHQALLSRKMDALNASLEKVLEG